MQEQKKRCNSNYKQAIATKAANKKGAASGTLVNRRGTVTITAAETA